MNSKQEKRFWSADQKRFVYSLKGAIVIAPFYYLIRLEIRLEFCNANLNARSHSAGQGDASQILTL